MRNLAVGLGSLMLGWVALGCGGVATGSRQQEETGPQAPLLDDEPATPVRPQGGSSSRPSNQAAGGSSSSSSSSSGTTSISVGGSFSTGTGEAGVGNEPSCESPVTRPLSPFVERVVEDATVAQQIAFASKELAGEWHGVVTTPWIPPYAVVASFGADGSYSAHCEHNSDFPDDQGCCRAFYYGSDRDSSLKQWSLASVNANGSVDGDINVAFCYDGEECYLPAWQGKLRQLQFNEAGDRMRFDFFTDDGYGPVKFDLERD